MRGKFACQDTAVVTSHWEELRKAGSWKAGCWFYWNPRQEVTERHVIVMLGADFKLRLRVVSSTGTLRKGGWLQGNSRSFFVLTGAAMILHGGFVQAVN